MAISDRKTDICNLILNSKFPFRKTLNLDKKIQFGVEIEFENADYYSVKRDLENRKKLNKWTIDDDATVKYIDGFSKYGGELISPILHDNVVSWNQIKSACHLIKRNYGLIRGRSAAHIHIDSSILNDDINSILNFVKIWTAYEHVIYRFSYGEDKKEREMLIEYAAPVANYFYDVIRNIEEYGFTGNVKNFYKYFFYSTLTDNMAAGISFMNCAGFPDEKNTIEVRCPNGTLNAKVWQNNINFFIKLLLYSASSYYDKDLIDKKIKDYKYKYLIDYSDIYFGDAEELMNLIFDSDDDKLYFLNQYLKINMSNKDNIIEKVKMK